MRKTTIYTFRERVRQAIGLYESIHSTFTRPFIIGATVFVKCIWTVRRSGI